MSAAAAAERRFAFGANWLRFLTQLDERRITSAEDSLRIMLGVQDLKGRTFLDIGCGSGLFSLAAVRLGASVTSFDYDPQSVACARAVEARYGARGADWRIEQGSVLDAAYMARFSGFDVVYSWGVLHHTGDMWRALESAARPAAAGGLLFIALYNDQGWISRYWLIVKRIYGTGAAGRAAMIALHAPYLLVLRALVRLIAGRGQLPRGMALWYDMLDWLGGLPFEVASVDTVVAFLDAQGFEPLRVVGCGSRHGCNEFVFRRREPRTP
ncbi:MAG TPA: class I SAM-dependent methyltransferase [Candidatus Cybelea sp.]|nr:class I SAM-dependent methyltransferase [Candidatus Cybelea sp.]